MLFNFYSPENYSYYLWGLLYRLIYTSLPACYNLRYTIFEHKHTSPFIKKIVISAFYHKNAGKNQAAANIWLLQLSVKQQASHGHTKKAASVRDAAFLVHKFHR